MSEPDYEYEDIGCQCQGTGEDDSLCAESEWEWQDDGYWQCTSCGDVQ